MHYFRHFLEFFGVSLAAMIVFFVIMLIVRGWRIPQCYICGAMKVRPSRPSGFMDAVARFFKIRPFRCEGCQARFHALAQFSQTERSNLSALVAFAPRSSRNSAALK